MNNNIGTRSDSNWSTGARSLVRQYGWAASLVVTLALILGMPKGLAARIAVRHALDDMTHELAIQTGYTKGFRRAPGRPLEVVPIQEGGPAWITSELTEALQSEGSFRASRIGVPLWVEATHNRDTFALSLGFVKTNERTSSPDSMPRRRRVRVLPWVAWLGTLIGVLTMLGIRRGGLGLGLAMQGLSTQFMLRLWPTNLTPPAFYEELRAGPIGASVLHIADLYLPKTFYDLLNLDLGAVAFAGTALISLYVGWRLARVLGAIEILLTLDSWLRAGALGWGLVPLGFVATWLAWRRIHPAVIKSE